MICVRAGIKKAVFIVCFFLSAGISAEEYDSINFYTGQLSSTIGIDSIQQKDRSMASGIDVALRPYSVLEIQNELFASPEVHDGYILTNTTDFLLLPRFFSIGRTMFGAGASIDNLQYRNNDTDTLNSIFPYGKIGQSVFFDGLTKVSVLPWVGAGKQYEFSVSDGPTSEETFSVISGIELNFYSNDAFDTELDYWAYYSYPDNNRNYNLQAKIKSILYKGFGISYQFHYKTTSSREDFFNGLGMFYNFPVN